MITHDLIQSSQAWHEFRTTHFGASEAAAMLGISPYKKRSALLHEKATGIVPDVDAGTQARFNEGHRSEALARAHMENILGVELYPCIGSDGGTLSASFDGLDEDGLVCWEHKSLNNDLRSITNANDLPEHYRVQMEQQLMVSGAPVCYFSATRWNGDVLAEEVQLKYAPDIALRERIRIGWAAFHRDLSTYTPPEIIQEAVAAPIKDFPAITYRMDGMRLTTNLSVDVKPAIFALVALSRKPLLVDQDFVNLDALCKKFKQAEDQCSLISAQADEEFQDIGKFKRDLKELSEIMRQARLEGEKSVTREKDARKLAIISKAKEYYISHVTALEAEIKPILLFKGPADLPDFAGAIKGMKKISAMQEAVDTALRDGKMLANATAQSIRVKLAWCRDSAANMSFLFPDLQQIINMEMEAFTATITNRIRTHKEAEAAKLEAERIRIQESRIRDEIAAKEAAIRAEERHIHSEEEINILIAQQEHLVSEHTKLIARIGDEISDMTKKGSKAWSTVPDGSMKWVGELRGNDKNKIPTQYESVDLFIAENNFGDEETMRKILIRFLDFIARE